MICFLNINVVQFIIASSYHHHCQFHNHLFHGSIIIIIILIMIIIIIIIIMIIVNVTLCVFESAVVGMEKLKYELTDRYYCKH